MLNSTLYSQLKENAPAFSQLQQKYNPLLNLVDILIGTIPNCDVIMEIWPTSFRTYNLLVPNLLNLPGILFRKKSIKELTGLAMYQSSVSAGCNYCTAHSCSFALRRGVDESTILGNLAEKEFVVMNFAKKMGEIPCTVTKRDFQALKPHCSKDEIESISMGVVLMGFLNKFMDVMGVELEQEAIDDVYKLLNKTEWTVGKHFKGKPTTTKTEKPKTDTLLTYLKVFRQAPGAIRIENQWLKETPKEIRKISSYLKSSIGHDFSLLEKIKRGKLKRALATVLKENFDKNNTSIGLRAKVLSGFAFFAAIENDYLQSEMLLLAKNNEMEISEELQQTISGYLMSQDAQFTADSQHTLSNQEITAINFAKQAFPSPANINDNLRTEMTNKFAPEGIVELVTWFSVLQLLHGLEKLPV